MKKLILGIVIVSSALTSIAQKDTAKTKKIIYTEPVQVPHTSVKILPPAYFVPSDKFNGFIHDGAGATIQITETEGKPYTFMAETMADTANLKKQGITLLSKENVKTKAGKDGVLILIGFSVKGPTKTFDYQRMIFLCGDYNKTIVVNANYPAIAKDILFEVLKQSLLTVQF